MTGGPGGDWDAIEEAIEGLPVARPQVDPRDAEVERLRAELSDLYPAIESLRDELRRAKDENNNLRAEIANEIHSALYGKEGHIHQSLLDEVDAAIKRHPNMDAEWWIGGSAAVSVIDRWLARSFAEAEGEK